MQTLFLTAAVLVQSPMPAFGEVFYKPPQIAERSMTALEPGLGDALPGATAVEQRAGLVWSLRQGLLLGALQCHAHYPTLLVTSNYNALLSNHAQELAGAYKTISGYFRRTVKGAAASQKALDSYITRATSLYSTVQSQPSFCYTAGWVGRKALYVPQGGLSQFATVHLGQLRDSLKGGRDQQFSIPIVHNEVPVTNLPSLDKRCWLRNGTFNARKCSASGAG